MSWLEAVILGLVEGITEFLPVSSTGHLILTRDLLGLEGDAVDRQLLIIQGAAILAVCWEFRQKLLHTAFTLHSEAVSRRFVVNMLIAFLPLAVLGLLFGSEIKAALFNPVSVAIALIVGGVIILWAERRQHEERVRSVDELTTLDAVKLGFFQALALIPGTSRSGATIIGGLLCGLSRKTAAEFSFFVAIPVLLAATAYELWEARADLASTDVEALILSCVVSFASALAATKLLIRFVSKHSFAAFAWYRIVFGAIILITAYTGVVSW
jgi:undecaprenyl-diphosphatase